MKRWQRYWFAEGGRYSAAALRIAIAIAVLLSLRQLATLSTVHIPGPPELYRPVGIWMLFGRLVPPDFVVTALWAIAFASTGLMLVGLFSRTTTAISFVAAVALVSASFASSKTWSHQYNVVFLAELAFLGARGGDVLSLDALIRRVRGQPSIDVPRGYQWSVRLVLLAVALMFAGAAFHKILHGHFTLRWALSDNLRHQLLVRYDLAGLPRPELADWIIDDVWRFRGAAVLNLISQTMPLLACIFVRRPWLRAGCGAFYVLEIVALGLIVNLRNWHWLPLAAVFIDWDRLIGRFVRLAPPAPTPPGWSPPRAQGWFVIAFVVYDAITSLVPTVDQTLNTYPFSGFPMFATVRAREPYDRHLPYSVPGDQFEPLVYKDKVLDERAQRWIDHMNRRLYTTSDPSLFRKRLAVILADVKARFGDDVYGLRHYLTVFEAPAYPQAARFEPHRIGIMGEIDEGTFRSVLGTLDDRGVTLRPENINTTGARLVVYANDDLTPRELTAPREGDRFLTGPIEGDPLYVVAVIDGKSWLVASRKAWRWE